MWIGGSVVWRVSDARDCAIFLFTPSRIHQFESSIEEHKVSVEQHVKENKHHIAIIPYSSMYL